MLDVDETANMIAECVYQFLDDKALHASSASIAEILRRTGMQLLEDSDVFATMNVAGTKPELTLVRGGK